MKVRKAEERGQVAFEWLQSAHTFSFGEYHDPNHMGFRVLRVLNDDVIAPGGGFPLHPHKDMEIITVVLEGTLSHADSLGHEQELKPGEVQYMCAGTGIRHSEYNASQTEPVHLLQLWIVPPERGLAPRYEQKEAPALPGAVLTPLVGKDPRAVIQSHQDMTLYRGALEPGSDFHFPITSHRGAWIHLFKGSGSINGVELKAGDAVALENENATFSASKEGMQFLLFDLA